MSCNEMFPTSSTPASATSIPVTGGESGVLRGPEGRLTQKDQEGLVLARYRQEQGVSPSLIIAFPEAAGPDLRAVIQTLRPGTPAADNFLAMLPHLLPGSGTVFMEGTPESVRLLAEVLFSAPFELFTNTVRELCASLIEVTTDVDTTDMPTVQTTGGEIVIEDPTEQETIESLMAGLMDKASQPSATLTAEEVDAIRDAMGKVDQDSYDDPMLESFIDGLVHGIGGAPPVGLGGTLRTDPRIFAFLIDVFDYVDDTEGVQRILLGALNDWSQDKTFYAYDFLGVDFDDQTGNPIQLYGGLSAYDRNFNR